MNNYSNIFDIPKILSGLERYTIIKKSKDFPNYCDFDDVDIMCLEHDKFIRNLVFKISQNKKQPIKIEINEKQYNTHVDIWPTAAMRLNLRFDVYRKFPYSKFKVEEAYFSSVIEESEICEYGEYSVYEPNQLDDLVIRFFEWVEHPHKERHLTSVKEGYNKFNHFIKILQQNTNIDNKTLRSIEEK